MGTCGDLEFAKRNGRKMSGNKKNREVLVDCTYDMFVYNMTTKGEENKKVK